MRTLLATPLAFVCLFSACSTPPSGPADVSSSSHDGGIAHTDAGPAADAAPMVDGAVHEDAAANDAESADATFDDAAESDAIATDGEPIDAGADDASVPDAASSDAAAADAAALDAVALDAVALDAAAPDAAAPDAAAPDAMPVDSGPPFPRAFYPSAPAWNDYLAADGANRFAATGAACLASRPGAYSACIHGGELRVFAVPGVASCTGLTASDALGAFTWTCIPGAPNVRIASTGLQADHGLSDLIDLAAAAPAWRPNTVTVRNGATILLTTASGVWWTNPIVLDNNGIPANAAVAGSIYVVGADPTQSYRLDADRVALLVRPGITMHGAAGQPVVLAAGRAFHWIEGAISANAASHAIHWTNVAFSVMRGVSASGSSANGIEIEGSKSNSLRRIRVVQNAGIGLRIATGVRNTASDVLAVDNNGDGIQIDGGDHNVMRQLQSYNNGGAGLSLLTATHDNTLSGVVSLSNQGDGILFSSANNNVAANVTTALNNGNSLNLISSNSNTFITAIMVTASAGLSETNTADNSFVDTAFGSGGFGITTINAANDRFTGELRISGSEIDCDVDPAATNPGLDFNCQIQGRSDAVVTFVSLRNSFIVAAVRQLYDTLSSIAMVGPFQAWGADSAQFPYELGSGRCVTGATCLLRDFSLALGDNGNAGAPAYLGVLAAPVAASTIDHHWQDNTTTNLLRRAVEIAEDDVGDDDGLCESGERCVISPNIGAYQGHGPLIAAGSIGAGGLVANVTLLRSQTNGY